jgi:Icc-related predicted phosphoesterase
MRLICISDTHGFHQDIVVPFGDILVHAGDVVTRNDFEAYRAFLAWFAGQPHRYKVLVAGNKDVLFETAPQVLTALMPAGVYYLQDRGAEIDGLKFWGSPYTPTFGTWSFGRDRGHEIARHWAMIPEGTDILITHGPAYGVLDLVVGGGHQGCENLRGRIGAIQPLAHLCGHLHGGYGTDILGHTQMVNASICDEHYQPVNAPIVLDL